MVGIDGGIMSNSQNLLTFEEYAKIAKDFELRRTCVIGTAVFHINDPLPYNGFYDVQFISFKNIIPPNLEPARMVDKDLPLIGLSGNISVNIEKNYNLLLDPDEHWRNLDFWSKRFHFLATMWFHFQRHMKPDRDYLMLLEARYQLWDLDLKGTLYGKQN